MEVDEHTLHVHIPTAEEIYENKEKEHEKSVEKIVKEILGPDIG